MYIIKIKKFLLVIFCLFIYQLQYSQTSNKNSFFEIVNQKRNEFTTSAKTSSKKSKTEQKRLEKERKKFARWQWFWESRIDKNGSLDTYNKEIFDNKNVKTTKNNRKDKLLAKSGINWNIVGPEVYPSGTNPSGLKGIGRIDAIVVNPNNANHVIIGANAGGIWETYDANSSSPNWTCLTNNLPVFTVKDLKIVNNTLFASTSNINAKFPTTLYGLGVIKKDLSSNDWYIPNEKFESRKLAISKQNPNIIYSVGKKYVFKSTDFGNSWIKLADPVASIQDSKILLTNIEIHPNDDDKVIISGRLHTHLSTKNQKTDILLFKTSNGGNSWSNLTLSLENYVNQLFTNTNDVVIDLHSNLNNHIATYQFNDSLYLGIKTPVLTGYDSNGNPIYSNRLYFVTMDSNWNNFNMLNSLSSGNSYYYSSDHMDFTFQVVDNSKILLGSWTFRVIDNASHNTRYYWYFSYSLHQDIRAVNYDSNSGRLFLGTDGGINRSFDTNSNVTFSSFPVITGNLNLFLAFNMSYFNQNGVRTLRIGTQDTGYYQNDDFGSGWTGWSRINLFGEGTVYSDSTNANIFYLIKQGERTRSNYHGGALYKTTNGGNNFIYKNTVGSYQRAPLEINPNNSSQLVFDDYRAYNRFPLSLSNDKMDNIVDISNGIQNLNYGKNLAIAISKDNPSTMYVAKTRVEFKDYGINNSFYKTTNLDFNNPSAITYTNIGNNLNAVDPNILSSAYIRDIEIDDNNENRVWITFSNLEGGKKVYYTSDGGNNWTNISSNLPNIPTSDAEYDSVNDKLYIANDYGVYLYDNYTGLWSKYGDNLPIAIVTTIKIDNTSNEIIAATHGRSIWTAPLTNCSNYIVTSNATWNTNHSICGNLIIKSGVNLQLSNATITANNIILENGASFTSTNGELVSNYFDTNNEKFKHNVITNSTSTITLNNTILKNYEVEVNTNTTLNITENITLEYSKLNIFDNGNYKQLASKNVHFSDKNSSINFFDNYNLSNSTSYAGKLDQIYFSGSGNMNVFSSSDIQATNLNLINSRNYNFDADQNITLGNDSGSISFTINNADVNLKASQSITMKPGTTIFSENFLAFTDGENITNFSKQETEDTEVNKKDDANKDDNGIEKFEVFPNPSSNYLNIKSINPDNSILTKFIIKDINGKKIFNGDLKGNSLSKLNITSFSQGIYFITFKNKNGISVKKFVKK
jgi:photosystem II stability/assembly factor-like uncharacterized protein